MLTTFCHKYRSAAWDGSRTLHRWRFPWSDQCFLQSPPPRIFVDGGMTELIAISPAWLSPASDVKAIEATASSNMVSAAWSPRRLKSIWLCLSPALEFACCFARPSWGRQGRMLDKYRASAKLVRTNRRYRPIYVRFRNLVLRQASWRVTVIDFPWPAARRHDTSMLRCVSVRGDKGAVAMDMEIVFRRFLSKRLRAVRLRGPPPFRIRAAPRRSTW